MTIDEALDRALDEIRFEGTTVDEYLDGHPEYADKLRPLLRNAARLGEAPEVRPNRQFKARLRKEFAPPKKRSLFGLWSFSFVLIMFLVIFFVAIWLGVNWDNSYVVNQLLPKLPMLMLTPAHALETWGSGFNEVLVNLGGLSG